MIVFDKMYDSHSLPELENDIYYWLNDDEEEGFLEGSEYRVTVEVVKNDE